MLEISATKLQQTFNSVRLNFLILIIPYWVWYYPIDFYQEHRYFFNFWPRYLTKSLYLNQLALKQKLFLGDIVKYKWFMLDDQAS